MNISGSSQQHALDTNSMYQIGLLCVAIASMLSGLSATLTQRAITGSTQRSTMLLSAEMAVYGIIFLLLNLVFNSNIKESPASLLSNWDVPTLLPVITNVSIVMCLLINSCLYHHNDLNVFMVGIGRYGCGFRD